MLHRACRETTSGALLTLLGSLTLYHSWSELAFGSLERMGPGMFPSALAIIIIALGLALIIPALFKKGDRIQRPDIRSTITILSAIAAFMFLLEPFGLFLSLMALVLISTLADCKFTVAKAALLGTVLCAVILVIFRFGFGLKITLFNWPW